MPDQNCLNLNRSVIIIKGHFCIEGQFCSVLLSTGAVMLNQPEQTGDEDGKQFLTPARRMAVPGSVLQKSVKCKTSKEELREILSFDPSLIEQSSPQAG
jgi:hypothetical protein